MGLLEALGGFTVSTDSPILRGLPGGWLPASPRVSWAFGLFFPCVRPSALGSWVVCHPVPLLSWVCVKRRGFVCMPSSGKLGQILGGLALGRYPPGLETLAG